MATKAPAKKRGLGRGLNALLSNSESLQVLTEPQAGDELREVAVDLIHRGPWQPRITFDEDLLQELADSISAQGVVQPIVLRSTVDGSGGVINREYPA
jgi:ParB family chromosome partitioning protein